MIMYKDGKRKLYMYYLKVKLIFKKVYAHKINTLSLLLIVWTNFSDLN